jgi:hypothetical protein
MGWDKKIKRLPEDTLFSNYIRERDGWKCKYRFKCYGGEDFSANKGGLDCSHCFKRGKWSTRFAPENCDAACKKCHHFIENEKDGQKTLEEWKTKQIGDLEFKKLFIRANTSDDTKSKLPFIKLYIKQLIKELKQNEQLHRKSDGKF